MLARTASTRAVTLRRVQNLKPVSHGRVTVLDSTRQMCAARIVVCGTRVPHTTMRAAHFGSRSKRRIVILLFGDVPRTVDDVQKKKSTKHDRITVEISSPVSHESDTTRLDTI